VVTRSFIRSLLITRRGLLDLSSHYCQNVHHPGPTAGVSWGVDSLGIMRRRVCSGDATRDGNNRRSCSQNRHRRRATMRIVYLVLSHFSHPGCLFSDPFLTFWHLRIFNILIFLSETATLGGPGPRVRPTVKRVVSPPRGVIPGNVDGI